MGHLVRMPTFISAYPCGTVKLCYEHVSVDSIPLSVALIKIWKGSDSASEHIIAVAVWTA